MRILLLGATGSAGGSVLQVCLESPQVEAVHAIVRRPPAVTHPKLRVFVHADYFDFTPVAEAFTGVDACLDCLGISVSQTSGEAEYRRITQDIALTAARTLRELSPSAAFHYLSGDGAALDSRFMWARVKAEAERDLMAEVDAVCWRPAAIDGVPSASEPMKYKILRPVIRVFFGRSKRFYVRGEEIGRAMLLAVEQGMRGRVVKNPEIRELAVRSRAL